MKCIHGQNEENQIIELHVEQSFGKLYLPRRQILITMNNFPWDRRVNARKKGHNEEREEI
jgi:hypothetical protein